MVSKCLCLLVAALLALAGQRALAEGPSRSLPALGAVAASGVAGKARSVGLPWAGSLRHGKLLRESSALRYLPAYADAGNFYGTEELVGMLQRSAAAIARRWPGSLLSVGELSARRGGWLSAHRSHRNGRDADIAFFVRDGRGALARIHAFAAFGRHAPLSGTPAHLRFDDARNWAIVESLLDDPHARVQYIFVSKPVRNRLLVEGRRRRSSAQRLREAAAVLVEPQRAEPHADHFHVRIFCPASHRPRCKDEAPYWPWYEGAPPGGQYAELPRIRWRPVAAAAAAARSSAL